MSLLTDILFASIAFVLPPQHTDRVRREKRRPSNAAPAQLELGQTSAERQGMHSATREEKTPKLPVIVF